MLELARSRLPDAAERLIVARAEAIPYADASFDAVVAIGVLEFADLEAALRELVRVLRPGGRAVLGFRNRRAPICVWQAAVVHPAARAVKRIVPLGRAIPRDRRLSVGPKHVTRLLEPAGLVVEQVATVGCAVLPDPLDHLFPGLAARAAERAEVSPARARRPPRRSSAPRAGR